MLVADSSKSLPDAVATIAAIDVRTTRNSGAVVDYVCGAAIHELYAWRIFV